ncbi:MAG: 3-deoxy-7-phosphoheptulonate synthase [Solirubrobacterales bacterium]|jgi:3-deoxy-7-phosphoheptulonate synthase|nr:3-deoxy-7-phosphoheptulonate synthase [Solirubrobacterales bacterium]
MLVIFHPDAAEPEIAAVLQRIHSTGAGSQRVDGAEQTVIGVIDGDRDHLAALELDADSGVDRVVPVSSPYKLAHKHRHGDRPYPVTVGGVAFGGPDAEFRMILGPCAVESAEQTFAAAAACKAAGADLLRGGAFKPRTSPYAFQGLGIEGLKILAEARDQTGLPIVTELTDLRDIDAVLEYADCIQVGARNMQHFPLLTEIGRAKLPVLLKRGLGASVDDFLLAAEYILTEGNSEVVLCERGIHAGATPARSCLDLAAVTVLKEHTHLPVIVDPSHAAGRRALVEPLALAAAACGADGLIVECHPNPAQARCDGPQAITLDALDAFCARVRGVAAAAAA